MGGDRMFFLDYNRAQWNYVTIWVDQHIHLITTMLIDKK